MPLPGALGSDLTVLASLLLKDGPRKVIPTPRRVRVIFNQTTIVDTTRAVWVWEHDYYPHFYIPSSELKNSTVRDKESIKGNASDGTVKAAIVELIVPERAGIPEKSTIRVLRFENDSSLGDLAGLVRLEFGAMDSWLEEDIPIFVHPKDPFKRIDILPSTRQVEVRIAGKTVAKSSFAQHLHETNLPVRYYLPLGSIDPAILRRSTTVTSCPYKGDANYYDVVLDGKEYKDVVWYYNFPIQESLAIAGLVSFYNEKVEILLDGKSLTQPVTHFT
ncbi:hypothetical protein TARUN_4544 [Trichoderma arundinaceum]|uniref:DUF427 domain-containing protein n=1 Tax=Trichoderma arundinaceum TaxID=490622 RepID=A0A395NNN2_TRIAR|nr:hypothetical protein TARUN_4544 [Trichoderma arundinaceum]